MAMNLTPHNSTPRRVPGARPPARKTHPVFASPIQSGEALTFARYYVKGAGSTGFLEYRLAYRFSDGRKIGFTVVIPDFEIRNSSPFAGRCHIARRLRAALRELRNKMDMAAFTNKRIGTPWSP